MLQKASQLTIITYKIKKIGRPLLLLCRKFVFILYVLQTVLSSFPPPCYGMELDGDIANSNTKNMNKNFIIELDPSDDPADDPSEKNPLLNSFNLNSSRKTSYTKPDKNDPVYLLGGHLSYYIDEEKPVLFPEYYKLFTSDLKVRSALIDFRKQPEIEGPFDWGKGLVLLKETDKIFVEGNPSKPLSMGWPWHILRGLGILSCGGIIVLFAGSPFGIDPTRLDLIDTLFPFLKVQSDASIGLSAGFAGYHVIPHGIEGLNTSTRLYKRFFKNWGLPDTHGLMTIENQEYKELRDLESLREQEIKDGMLKDKLTQTTEIETAKISALKKPHIATICYLDHTSLIRKILHFSFSILEKFVDKSFYIWFYYKLRPMGESPEKDILNSIAPWELALYIKKNNESDTLYVKLQNKKEMPIKRSDDPSDDRGCSTTSYDNILNSLNNPEAELNWLDEETLLQCTLSCGYARDNWGKKWEEATADLLGKALKYGIIGFVGIMVSLLFGLTFLNVEEYNSQSLYAKFFEAAVLAFVFSTTVDNGCKQWDRSSHKALNKANPSVNNKKKALIQTLGKTQELINAKTINSDGFVDRLYEGYTQQTLEESEFSKFSLLFVKVTPPTEPTDPVAKTNEMTMWKVTKNPKSWLRSYTGKIGTFGVAAWSIPAFFIFWNVANNTLKFAGLNKDISYWASIPISMSVTGFGIIEGWKQQPKINTRLLDFLSPSRPLYLLSWLFLLPALSSAIWSTSSYSGVLADMLFNTNPLVKYTTIGLSAFLIPRILLWELERWNDFVSFFITLCNSRIQRRIYLNNEIERAKEAIFEWDEETVNQYTYTLWGMQ